MLQYLYAAYSIPNYAQGAALVQSGRWLPAELEPPAAPKTGAATAARAARCWKSPMKK